MEIKGHTHNLGRIGYPRGGLECGACDRSYSDGCDPSICEGFHCLKCEFEVHTKCLFVFNIQETLFEHPLHVGHGLKLLTTGAPDHTDPKCHICCSQSHLNMPWHNHTLLMLDVGDDMRCKVCGKPGGYGYCCPRCWLMVHEKCVSVFDSPEITHSCHARHSLKLLTEGAPDYTDLKCHLCGKKTGNFLYHCDICKFNMDMACAIRRPLPVTLSSLKVHEHTLKLIPRLISFVCDACGKKGDRSPYVCLQCDLMFFHQECARLPRVIHVNRHDHRVSYKYPLGLGEWKCGICLIKIDWSYGAYSCSTCPSYALHSRCATREDVWDGEELDGVPEEVEDIEPFKTNDDNTITHFAHEEHNLSLNNDGIALEESILCGACVRPVGSNAFYKCSECSFIIDETCANLPKKKRHFLSPRPLTLHPNRDNTETIVCHACIQWCCQGFMYTDGDGTYDLICSSMTMPFIHGSHPHPLLYLQDRNISVRERCQSCLGGLFEEFLGCIECNYFLDFRCATLPLSIRLDRYDDHPLTLCYGEKASGKYWCDICERETDPETWFYTCEHCGVTLHVFCVLGNLRYAKPGGKIEGDLEVRFNNTSTRPLCNNCHCRCAAPFFFVKEKADLLRMILDLRVHADLLRRILKCYLILPLRLSCVHPLERILNLCTQSHIHPFHSSYRFRSLA
ncbi:uncharacterized protein LOC18013065 [Eutrema salsugineum]|uniref:uncharacterized protein LOC18013065 n=1 Tax=Eutrema salsugineum TaxID=72664 RepID=UPI000CED2FDA|nr:uncharacterized protein LOC18013065 [Eutrema salsugineum]